MRTLPPSIKMKYIVAILLLGFAAIAYSHPLATWEQFKEEHEKVYQNTDEESRRMKIFVDNWIAINEHNKLFKEGKTTYERAINQFADMLPEEVIQSGFLPLDELEDAETFEPNMTQELPEQMDWRKVGSVVTPVQNQGRCGSCWAFSTTGAMEGQYNQKYHKSMKFSEQQLVDCSDENYGCNGGLPSLAYKYIEKNGLESAEAYPYVAKGRRCAYDSKQVIVGASGFKRIYRGSERALKYVVAKVGPISVGIDAERSLMHYRKGIYQEPACSSRHLNHGVLVVGYGTHEGQDYWIIKNSWGSRWGENGYFRMIRNGGNMCGVATDATFPQIKAWPQE